MKPKNKNKKKEPKNPQSVHCNGNLLRLTKNLNFCPILVEVWVGCLFLQYSDKHKVHIVYSHLKDNVISCNYSIYF